MSEQREHSDRLITGEEVDRIFSIQKTTRYRYIKARVIPQPIRLSPNAVRWSHRECMEALERHKSAPRPGRTQ